MWYFLKQFYYFFHTLINFERNTHPDMKLHARNPQYFTTFNTVTYTHTQTHEPPPHTNHVRNDRPMIKIFVKFTCFSRRFRHRSAHQHIKTWVFFSEKCILVCVCLTVLKELIRNQWDEKRWVEVKEGDVNVGECPTQAVPLRATSWIKLTSKKSVWNIEIYVFILLIIK